MIFAGFVLQKKRVRLTEVFQTESIYRYDFLAVFLIAYHL